jgi:ribosomal protein S24E
MELKITERQEQPLLSREYIEAEIEFKGAIPSRKQIMEALAQEASISQDSLAVIKIDSIFGDGKIWITAYSYKSKEVLESVESKRKLVRTALREDLKKAPAAAAPAK